LKNCISAWLIDSNCRTSLYWPKIVSKEDAA
jgi:hypothetical protein